jgi:hypothetical protein
MKLHRAFGVIKESKDMNSICASFALPSLCITVLPICRTPEESNHYYFLNKNKAKASDKYITKKSKKSNQPRKTKTKTIIAKSPPVEPTTSSITSSTTTTTTTTEKPSVAKEIEFSGDSNSYYEESPGNFATDHPFHHRRRRRNGMDFLNIKNAYPPTKQSENLRRICRSDCELLEVSHGKTATFFKFQNLIFFYCFNIFKYRTKFAKRSTQLV